MYLLLCRNPVTGRTLRCVVLHPLHQCMQISIPVSKCQPLTIPMNTKIFFLKLENFQHCSAARARQSEWALLSLGYCGKTSGHFLHWLNFEGWWQYLQYAWICFHQVCGKSTHRARERRGAACTGAVQGQGVPCHPDAVPCTCLASWHVQGMDILEWNSLSLSCLQG